MPTPTESLSIDRASPTLDKEFSLLDEPVHFSVQLADSPVDLHSVSSPIHETELSPLNESVNSSIQLADSPMKLGEVADNEPDDRPIPMDSSIDKGEMQTDVSLSVCIFNDC